MNQGRIVTLLLVAVWLAGCGGPAGRPEPEPASELVGCFSRNGDLTYWSEEETLTGSRIGEQEVARFYSTSVPYITGDNIRSPAGSQWFIIRDDEYGDLYASGVANEYKTEVYLLDEAFPYRLIVGSGGVYLLERAGLLEPAGVMMVPKLSHSWGWDGVLLNDSPDGLLAELDECFSSDVPPLVIPEGRPDDPRVVVPERTDERVDGSATSSRPALRGGNTPGGTTIICQPGAVCPGGSVGSVGGTGVGEVEVN